MGILRETDRSSVVDVARKHRVSEQTIYVWRRHFCKLEPADVKRLRELGAENAKLKRMIAEHEMVIESLKEINTLLRRDWELYSDYGDQPQTSVFEATGCLTAGHSCGTSAA